MAKQYYVYIMTNKSNRTLYTGVTNNLERRVYEHKQRLMPGFTQKYRVDKLVWYEASSDIRNVIAEEKRIKAGSRIKKIERVKLMNPAWEDLSNGWRLSAD